MSSLIDAGLELLSEVSKAEALAARLGPMGAVEDALAAKLGKLWKVQGGHFIRILPSNGGLSTWFDSWKEAAGLSRPDFRDAIDTALAISMVSGASVNFNAVGEAGLSFALTNPRAIWWMAHHGGELIKGLEKETADRLRTVITEARAAGLAYTKLERQLRSEFGDMSRKRARVVAVTETAFGYEAGNKMAADMMLEAGLKLEKQHLAIGDSCELCKENAQQGWIESDMAFINGDPPVHPACRCTAQYRRVGVNG